MGDIQSNQDQLAALTANEKQEPFVMLNLLKFKDKEGRADYFRYIKESGPYVEAVGAKVLYFGKADELIYGTEKWDVVMLVWYPSRKSFLEMANNPDYLKTHEHREKALEKAVLYATDPIHYKDILSP